MPAGPPRQHSQGGILDRDARSQSPSTSSPPAAPGVMSPPSPFSATENLGGPHTHVQVALPGGTQSVQLAKLNQVAGSVFGLKVQQQR